MLKYSLMVSALLLVAGTKSVGQSCGGAVPSGMTIAIDAHTKNLIIGQIANAIKEEYLYPDRTDELVDFLNNSLKSGAYDIYNNGAYFAAAVTDDLRGKSNDLHFSLSIIPNGPEMPVSSCSSMMRKPELSKNINYGFRTVKQLAGNIGYIEMTMFIDTALSRPKVEAAMQFLSGVDALIIDLRAAPGGETPIGQLMAGYLMKPNTELHTRWSGQSGRSRVVRVIEPTNAAPRLDMPVYILTGPTTASAAEALAYDLKNLGRATIVGEKTMGAGHCANIVTFAYPNFEVDFMVPTENPINPITKTSWEGVGVEPDIPVPAGDALAEAHKRALMKLASMTPDPADNWSLQWASMAIKREYGGLTLSASELAEYAGTYGPRHIIFQDGGLVYKRDGFPAAHKLIPIDDDLFAMEDADIMRLRFDRNKSGQIVRLTGLYDTGNQDSNPKDQ